MSYLSTKIVEANIIKFLNEMKNSELFKKNTLFQKSDDF